MNPTVKITVRGASERVEAVIARLKEVFVVTYESKTRPLHLSEDDVSRFVRVRPPAPKECVS